LGEKYWIEDGLYDDMLEKQDQLVVRTHIFDIVLVKKHNNTNNALINVY